LRRSEAVFSGKMLLEAALLRHTRQSESLSTWGAAAGSRVPPGTGDPYYLIPVLVVGAFKCRARSGVQSCIPSRCRCRSQDGSTTLPPFMQMCIRRASPHGHVSRFVILLGASHDIRRVLRLVLPRRRAEQNYLPWTLSTQQVKLQMLLRLTTETCRCVVGRDEYSTNDRLSVSLFTGLSMTKVGS